MAAKKKASKKSNGTNDLGGERAIIRQTTQYNRAMRKIAESSDRVYAGKGLAWITRDTKGKLEGVYGTVGGMPREKVSDVPMYVTMYGPKAFQSGKPKPKPKGRGGSSKNK